MNTAPIDGKLSFDDCWELLASAVIGRLALVVDGHPEIFPVNFVVERRSVVFRTGAGTKLWQSAKDERMAADALGLEPWEPGTKAHYVRLEPSVLTGRRFSVSGPDVWNTRWNDPRRTSFE